MTHQLPEDERAEVNTRLSIFLEEKRKESGMTAEEFANSLGMSRQTLANFKKSRAFPSVETILNIKKKYADLSLDQLIAGDAPLEAKVSVGSNGGSEIVRYQEAEVARLIKQATERSEAEAQKYKDKYEALADKVLEKAGFNEGVATDPSMEADIQLVRFLAISNFGGSYGRG